MLVPWSSSRRLSTRAASTMCVVGGTDRNWAHSEEFDSDAMAEFEARLGRARAANRPGYLRVKAATLLGLAHPTATVVAVQLLRRVVADYDDFIEVPWSHELLGHAYRNSGDLAAAERHLRLAISSADERRNGLSLPELTLAEVLLEKGEVDAAQTVLDQVRKMSRGMAWNSQLYRFAVTSARCADLLGSDGSSWAQEALDLAGHEEPQLPRHPTIGLVDAEDGTLAEMRQMAQTGSPSTKWWKRRN